MALLEIEDLHVDFPSQGAVMHAVEGVSLSLDEGEVLGIVGESGSGKSVTMLAVMGLVAYPGPVRAKRLRFAGRDLLHAVRPRAPQASSASDVAMIFQEPTTSLNPCFTDRLPARRDAAPASRASTARRRASARSSCSSRSAFRRRRRRLNDFPHQMSGGMNQRVMIAMAIACNPRLLIADEPTTALDVTIQAQILDLLRGLQKERGMALVLVTHNMGVVAEMARRVAVMYAGQVVEERARRRAVRGAAASVHRGAARGDARAPATAATRLATIPGVVPGLYDRPPGCLFAPRCAYATPRRARSGPALRPWQRRPRPLPLSAGRPGRATRASRAIARRSRRP